VTTRDERGQATVELALLLPIVAVLLLGTLQVALIARDQVLVTHAAREAARVAAVDPGPGAPLAAALAAAPLDRDRLKVQVSGRGPAGSRVTVVVTYRALTRVPIIGALLRDPVLTARATMRVE
jgi:Flp pilus assembly protein TadG